MRLPIIQAESQKAQIAIDWQLGGYDIRTQQPEIQVQTTPTKISAPTPTPELELDQTRMWEAFNGGKPMAFVNRIYSQMPEIALQGIAQIVEKGNRMGDLRIKQNPIPDLAYQGMLNGKPHVEVFGQASYHNVDIHFNIQKPDVQVEVGKVEVNAVLHKPDINYNRGDFKIYMKQYPAVRFQVSDLDVRV